jgi:hypothetical protein
MTLGTRVAGAASVVMGQTHSRLESDPDDDTPIVNTTTVSTKPPKATAEQLAEIKVVDQGAKKSD